MKTVAFACLATEAVALILNKNTTKVFTNVTVHSAAQVHIEPEKLSDEEVKEARRKLKEFNEARKELKSSNEALGDDEKNAEGFSEITPKNTDKLSGTCEDNVMRCVYVHALPQDFCMKTHQPPWCKHYVEQPACVMVKNYDYYIEQYVEDNSELAPHTAEEHARHILSGDPKEALDAQCFGTRGWGKPYTFDSTKETLPSCKSADSLGLCKGHWDGKTYNCPICGEGSGQTKGAIADNDVIR